MDAAESKHVTLGFIFFTYIFDAFQVRYDAIKAKPHEYQAADHKTKFRE